MARSPRTRAPAPAPLLPPVAEADRAPDFPTAPPPMLPVLVRTRGEQTVIDPRTRCERDAQDAARANDHDERRADVETEEARRARLLCLSHLMGALERGYAAIRHNFPEVPHAMVTLGSGAEKVKGAVQLAKHGHYDRARWIDLTETEPTAAVFPGAPRARVSEVMVAGETLDRGATAVFGTLLHEAAHALALARGHKDGGTSRQGRYHNEKYRSCAQEMGMEVTEGPTFGWHVTRLTPSSEMRYATDIAAIGVHLGNYLRALPVEAQKVRKAPTAKPITNLMIRAQFGPLLAWFPVAPDSASLAATVAAIPGVTTATVYAMHKEGLNAPGAELGTWSARDGWRVDATADASPNVPDGWAEALIAGAAAWTPLPENTPDADARETDGDTDSDADGWF